MRRSPMHVLRVKMCDGRKLDSFQVGTGARHRGRDHPLQRKHNRGISCTHTATPLSICPHDHLLVENCKRIWRKIVKNLKSADLKNRPADCLGLKYELNNWLQTEQGRDRKGKTISLYGSCCSLMLKYTSGNKNIVYNAVLNASRKTDFITGFMIGLSDAFFQSKARLRHRRRLCAFTKTQVRNRAPWCAQSRNRKEERVPEKALRCFRCHSALWLTKPSSWQFACCVLKTDIHNLKWIFTAEQKIRYRYFLHWEEEK